MNPFQKELIQIKHISDYFSTISFDKVSYQIFSLHADVIKTLTAKISVMKKTARL